MRVKIQLQCTECKRKNYSTMKNKKNTTGRIELKNIALRQAAYGSQGVQVVS